ncbi:hypothetical protein [uncultured Olleya sp.]|uniref:hypothetical protein n=1 Tax=uncultured Olleya sp. TaxID=757243 RepID=UPI002591E8A1|nr:hypothetical protein [uncultured Olleya sp.]
MAKQKKVREIRLLLSSLRFEPYAELANNHTTKSILKEIFSYLRTQKKNGKGHLIDRHEKRDKAEPRELFMISHRDIPSEGRIRCSMALLRKGKQPKLKPTDEFKLLPLSSIDGDIAEDTHFFIDYNSSKCVICAEYNDKGPRLSDLEYYFRSVVGPSNLKIAKSTSMSAFFNNTIDETLHEMRNVLHMDVKFKPSKLARMDVDVRKQYYSGMENIGKVFKPKFFRIETYFQTPGSNKVNKTNNEANNWFREMLKIFKTRERNNKLYENFEVKYENNEGAEKVFNLLNSRRTIIIEVDSKEDVKNKEMYNLISSDLSKFVASL